VVEFSAKAIADLEQISDWIAADNPRLAAKKAAMIADTCELLDTFRDMGTAYVGPSRYFIKDLWVIVYRPTERGVYIYRVFDSRQDWASQNI